MKTIKMFLVIMFLIPVMAIAGDINITITKDGKPFAKQPVTILDIKGAVIKSDSTDAFGYISLKIKQVGQFKLQAGGAAADIFSNNSPTRYSFTLIQNKTGWQLIKK